MEIRDQSLTSSPSSHGDAAGTSTAPLLPPSSSKTSPSTSPGRRLVGVVGAGEEVGHPRSRGLRQRSISEGNLNEVLEGLFAEVDTEGKVRTCGRVAQEGTVAITIRNKTKSKADE